jgi:hypothetical protein
MHLSGSTSSCGEPCLEGCTETVLYITLLHFRCLMNLRIATILLCFIAALSISNRRICLEACFRPGTQGWWPGNLTQPSKSYSQSGRSCHFVSPTNSSFRKELFEALLFLRPRCCGRQFISRYVCIAQTYYIVDRHSILFGLGVTNNELGDFFFKKKLGIPRIIPF